MLWKTFQMMKYGHNEFMMYEKTDQSGIFDVNKFFSHEAPNHFILI